MMDRSREERRAQADRPVWVSFDGGKTWHNAAISRHKPWRRDVWTLGVLLIALVCVGWWQVGSLASDIQDSRETTTLELCQDTNDRHDAALVALDVLADQAVEDDPQREEEIRTGTEQFKVFVEALVPERDCERRVEALAID